MEFRKIARKDKLFDLKFILIWLAVAIPLCGAYLYGAHNYYKACNPNQIHYDQERCEVYEEERED